ncbi:hypothetical protein GCM10009547_27920 [Sporichthya brevicatena]|uniref:SCP domain-containing protein n=1 Tax=Sporichthya brevicatena TaxID=171442 RepID=A0ABN1GY27_9ACTN
MNRRRTAPGRVLVVAFLAATGLVAYAAPGLAAEAGPTPPLTAVAATPAEPAQPAARTGDDPDDEPSGGGWRGTREDEDSDGDSREEEYDSAGSSDADERYVVDGEKKSSKAKSTRITTKKKKDSKKSAKAKQAAKKKAAKKAAAKKAKQKAAAKKKREQALKAARAAQQREQQRRARADDGDSGGSIDSMRQAILDLTNRARASAGCGRLRYSTQLERSAQAHANDMAKHNYMSHTSRSGKNSDQRIRATGFNGDKTGENLANGFSSPESVFKAWMNSPSHRRNILDCKFKILGVGYVGSGGYWVQHFGG